MTRCILIRHGDYDSLGSFLAGRMAGVWLNDTGKRQATALIERLGGFMIDAVVSSPLERAVQTASPLATAHGILVQTREQLTDIDYGEWTGKQVGVLEDDSDWRRFNTFRTGTIPPGGESILQVQVRMVHDLFALMEQFPKGCVVVVSHADPLKALVSHFLGMPLELMSRLAIAPASITVLDIDRWGACVRCLGAESASPIDV